MSIALNSISIAGALSFCIQLCITHAFLHFANNLLHTAFYSFACMLIEPAFKLLYFTLYFIFYGIIYHFLSPPASIIEENTQS